MGTAGRYEKVSRDLASGRIARLARPNRRPAIFMDRDGTLVEEVDLLHCVDDLKLFPFSARAVKTINGSDFLSLVVTNQPVVARNLCSMEDVREVHRKLETLLGDEGAYVDDIYFCPHHPDRGYPEENPLYKIDCSCRKPNTGMIEAAAREHPVDLSSSWMIGDRTTDIQTGVNAGLATILVRTGMGGKDGRFDVRPRALHKDGVRDEDLPLRRLELDDDLGHPDVVQVAGLAHEPRPTTPGACPMSSRARASPARTRLQNRSSK